MPSSFSPQPFDETHVTRQQLDELDALLQRMLALPVHPFEEEAVAPAPACDASVAVLEPEPELPELSPLASTNLAPPSYSFLVDPSPTAEGQERSTPEHEPTSDDVEPPPSLWLWPLILGNQLFDLAAGCLGRPGRWLRRPAGRTLLGWTGLLLFAGAVALLILDWIRWNW